MNSFVDIEVDREEHVTDADRAEWVNARYVAEKGSANVKRRIVSALLENEAGALPSGRAFAQRNYNIESLTVAPTEDSSLSRLTLTTSASDAEIEQITKQLNKLVEVVKLADITESAHVERELMLVKVKAGRQVAPR